MVASTPVLHRHWAPGDNAGRVTTHRPRPTTQQHMAGSAPRPPAVEARRPRTSHGTTTLNECRSTVALDDLVFDQSPVRIRSAPGAMSRCGATRRPRRARAPRDRPPGIGSLRRGGAEPPGADHSALRCLVERMSSNCYVVGDRALQPAPTTSDRSAHRRLGLVDGVGRAPLSPRRPRSTESRVRPTRALSGRHRVRRRISARHPQAAQARPGPGRSRSITTSCGTDRSRRLPAKRSTSRRPTG